MGEYFELTFFSHKVGQKEELCLLQELLNVRKDRHTAPMRNRFSFLDGRELYFTAFVGQDYYEYELSVGQVHMTPDNIEATLPQMLELVDQCFCQAPALAFATGMFESTGYYLDGITSMKEFNSKNLSAFPFLFFRGEHQFGLTPTGRYRKTWYLFRQGKDVQDIFG